MKNKKAFFTTKWIVYTAMFTALVAATGFLPAIPGPGGNIYWVDGMVLIAAYLMDPLSAFISGGIGTLLYDVLKSPSMMIPSLFIHGLQGAIVSAILHYTLPKKFNGTKLEFVWALISSIIAAVEVVLGYFIYRYTIYGTATAAASIPRNVIQETIGIAVALIICYATTFKRQLKKNNLLPDFRREVLGKDSKKADSADLSESGTEASPSAADAETK